MGKESENGASRFEAAKRFIEETMLSVLRAHADGKVSSPEEREAVLEKALEVFAGLSEAEREDLKGYLEYIRRHHRNPS